MTGPEGSFPHQLQAAVPVKPQAVGTYNPVICHPGSMMGEEQVHCDNQLIIN